MTTHHRKPVGRLERWHRSQKQELNPRFDAVRCASTAQQRRPRSAQHSLHCRHCSLSSHQPHRLARAGKTHLTEDKRMVSQLVQRRNRLLNSSQLPGSVATSVLSSLAWESLTFQWNTLCLNGCSYCTSGPFQWNPKRGVKGPEQFQGFFSWFLLVGHPQFRSRLVARYLMTGVIGFQGQALESGSEHLRTPSQSLGKGLVWNVQATPHTSIYLAVGSDQMSVTALDTLGLPHFLSHKSSPQCG